MKMMKVMTLLSVVLCVNTQAMELPLEGQLLHGTLSVADYLQYIRNNPDVWGTFSGKVLALAAADYSDYHENLYETLLTDIDNNVVGVYRLLFNEGSLDLTSCINAVLQQIKRKIDAYYLALRSGMRSQLIKEGNVENV